MNTPASLDGSVGQLAGSAPSLPQVAEADASVNEYLLAHHAYSPATAIHGVAPYVRNASANVRERDMTR
jgi:sigma-E factor negative regulatory protein RseA